VVGEAKPYLDGNKGENRTAFCLAQEVFIGPLCVFLKRFKTAKKNETKLTKKSKLLACVAYTAKVKSFCKVIYERHTLISFLRTNRLSSGSRLNRKTACGRNRRNKHLPRRAYNRVCLIKRAARATPEVKSSGFLGARLWRKNGRLLNCNRDNATLAFEIKALACSRQGRSEGGTMFQAPKSPNNVASTFFRTVNVLRKDLGFEHGGAKRVSCPGRHLTCLRPRH